MTRENIATSGDVMIHYLKTHGGPRVYLAGTPELEAQFREAGFTLLPSDTETADFAVLGFDTTFNFEKADAISRLITGGVPFRDQYRQVCPLEDGRFCPDCGSMACMITHATGVEPNLWGNRLRETVDYILAKTGTRRKERRWWATACIRT